MARGGETWYTHTGPVKVRISQKLTPWITQTTLTGRVAAVVIEFWGDQPEVDVKGRLHAIIELTRLAHR